MTDTEFAYYGVRNLSESKKSTRPFLGSKKSPEHCPGICHESMLFSAVSQLKIELDSPQSRH